MNLKKGHFNLPYTNNFRNPYTKAWKQQKAGLFPKSSIEVN